MERNKTSNASNRIGKKVQSHASNEFFALGSKSYRDESKTKIGSIAKVVSTAGIERKRDAPGTSSMMVNKKVKLSTTNIRNSNEVSATPNAGPLYELWDQMTSDCESADIVKTSLTAIEQNDMESAVRLICVCMKNVVNSYSKTKPDIIAWLSVFYLAKVCPNCFTNTTLYSGLLHLLRRDFNVKVRQNMYSHALATNILVRLYNDKEVWPESFLRIFIEDAINERFWADNNMCAPFIENIAASFNTRTPQLNFQQSDNNFGSASSSANTLSATSSSNTAANQNQQQQPGQSVTSVSIDDDSCDNSECSSSVKPVPDVRLHYTCDVFNCEIKDRYIGSEHVVEKHVTDSIKEQLNKRQQQECYTKNLLKFLCKTCGLSEVRYLCISRLELWIHNGKLVKFAQELLSYICFNVRAQNCKDHEVLAILVKIRLKAKHLINFYMACIKEMIHLEPDILSIILKLVVQNELSNTRNPNNMGMLGTMFQTAGDDSAKHLAEIYKEFLLQRDDCLRTLRVFLRELVRMLRNDINLVVFCKVFLNCRPELNKVIELADFRERIFHSMVDIACLCMLLSVSPQVREASISLRVNKDNNHNNDILIKFYNQMCQIQLDTVSWMYEVVPILFKLQASDYNQGLHKILLLENPEQYSRHDQWPSEPERTTLLRLVSETPIHEDTLLQIILIGITKEIPFNIPDTFDIIILLLKRTSTMRTLNCPLVQANKFDIIDFLFSMSEYHHPENINLPQDYEPPKLAIIVLYWKAWLILLMISAHNPSTFGAFCWNHYPTMKMLMEMCITNQFNETVISKEELQIVTLERDHIVEFESYLAAQTSQAVITEDNAILTSQLMLMDPMGAARRVPNVVLEQLRYLNKINKIGHLLCRSRKPDLLLDIIQRQGTTQSMPWLSDLVQNSEGDFNHLPVQCLCEFLLFNANIINEENSRHAELVNFLRNVITEPSYDKQMVCEILDYIFRRLCSTVKQSRLSALRGLRIIFNCTELSPYDWLLSAIPQLPHFNSVRIYIIPQLRSACQVENSPDLVMAYIQFIAAHTLNDSVADMLDHVIDMAQLIVERSTMFQHIIPSADSDNKEDEEAVTRIDDISSDDKIIVSEANKIEQENRLQTLKCLFVMFNNYIIKLRDHHEPYQWTEYPDLLMVQFNDGMQLPLHLNIIHAFIILLTHSSYNMPESMPILDYWFPLGGTVPTAYIPNMPHESVQLLPDWLKLKMIRSPVDRLIEAAIRDLTPDQIVLFVQNFGTPINSMSKLLALLDRAVIEQFDAVKNAILNKAYLAQLIEIQQMRGAKNGHVTVQALGLYSHSQTVADNPKIRTDVLEEFEFNDIIESAAFRAPKDTTMSTSNLITMKTTTNTAMANEKWSDKIIQQLTQQQNKQYINDGDYRMLVHELFGATNSTQCVQFLSELSNVEILLNNMKPYQILSLIRLIANTPSHKMVPKHHNRIMEVFVKALHVMRDNTNLQINVMEIIRKFLHNTQIGKHKTREIVLMDTALNSDKALSIILKQFNENINVESINNTQKLYKTGLLVDILSQNDPELRTVFNTNGYHYIFSKTCGNFRFYLLSWLCHEANWHIIVKTLNYLLTKCCNDVNFEHLDCTAILNFIQSIISNPKLWQGRDNYTEKFDQSENIIKLDHNELKMFTEFIIRETEIEFRKGETRYGLELCSRINLLFRTARNSITNLTKFVEYVHNCNCSEQLRLRVLRQTYVMYPSIKFFCSQKLGEHTAKLKYLNGCPADKAIDNLITCLGNLLAKKDFEMFSSDTELLLRKVAACHPGLFIRQLGVLGSLIQGRSELGTAIMREQHHIHRFIQVLRLIELLQPICFDDIYREELQKSLECYFAFFKQYKNVKESYNLLISFAELLQTYIKANPLTALSFIEQYVSILLDLENRYNNIIALQDLVQRMTLLQQKKLSAVVDIIMNDDENVKQEYDLENSTDIKMITTGVGNVPKVDSMDGNCYEYQLDMDNRGLVTLNISSRINKPRGTTIHFNNLAKIVKQYNSEDIIVAPLHEIECMTSKRFALLSELFDRLLELIFSPSAQIRSNAYILLIRHLKYNPGRSDFNNCALNAFMQCLCADNPSVASTAADNLVEMTLLLQEHATKILSTAFSLSIKSRLNTAPQIKKILQTIMLQHGY